MADLRFLKVQRSHLLPEDGLLGISHLDCGKHVYLGGFDSAFLPLSLNSFGLSAKNLTSVLGTMSMVDEMMGLEDKFKGNKSKAIFQSLKLKGRNQRMLEDQFVHARRRIYYDQNGSEALICSDNEEQLVEDDEEKREYAESEDRIIQLA